MISSLGEVEAEQVCLPVKLFALPLVVTVFVCVGGLHIM